MEDDSSPSAIPGGKPKQRRSKKSLKQAYKFLTLHREQIENIQHSLQALIATMKQTGISGLEQKLNKNLHYYHNHKEKSKEKGKPKGASESDKDTSKVPAGASQDPEKMPVDKGPSARKFQF